MKLDEKEQDGYMSSQINELEVGNYCEWARGKKLFLFVRLS